MYHVGEKYSVDRLRYFKFYNLAKSTALVVAIFPLFLYKQLGLCEADIVRISSYSFLLPLILEIPLGFFSDYFGSLKLVKLGIFVFTFAYISLLIFPNYVAYYLYVFAISLAAACFSGAEDSLLVSIIPDNVDLFSVKADLASFVYQKTTILLLLGGMLYYFAPYSPFILQVISLISAYLFLVKTTDKLIIHKNKQAYNLLNSVLHSKKDILNLYKFSIVLLIAISSFIVLINNRTVSIHFAKILNYNPAIIVSIIFVLGNLLSSKANLWFKTYFKQYSTPIIPISIIGILAISSFLVMSLPSFFSLALGFLLLAIFKASYRAYLSSALVSSIYNTSYTATILSICSLLTAIISFILSLVYAYIFTDFHLANLYLAILLFIIFALSILTIYLKRSEIICIKHSHAFSDKQHFIKRYYQNFIYAQKYPKNSDINDALKNRYYTKCLYPAPMLLKVSDNIIEWEYIKGKRLSEIERAGQMEVIKKLIDIFTQRLNNNIILSHGDLHPDNIMVKNNGSFSVIDWDLCQNLPQNFDILTLFTHPDLKLKINERIKFLSNLLNLSDEKAKHIIQSFLKNKIEHLSNIKNIEIKLLIEKYKNLKRDMVFAR